MMHHTRSLLVIRPLICRFVLFVTPILLLALLTPAAIGQDPPHGELLNPTDNQPSCVFYDSCTWDTGGNYTYCVARSSQGQLCQDIVTFYSEPGTLCANGCNSCAGVKYSASCNCDAETHKTTGKCTYW